jgi:hypothetical protein
MPIPDRRTRQLVELGLPAWPCPKCGKPVGLDLGTIAADLLTHEEFAWLRALMRDVLARRAARAKEGEAPGGEGRPGVRPAGVNRNGRGV